MTAKVGGHLHPNEGHEAVRGIMAQEVGDRLSEGDAPLNFELECGD